MSAKQAAPSNKFIILYASQTGQAKAIAEEIADKAPEHGLKADLFCLSLIDKRFSIEKETCAVFIVSTTGDGEPPDTAVKFFHRISRHTLKQNYLENLNYALLALGDSNYIKFCLFGRRLELRLKALSAKCFYATGYGDDAFGIEAGVDPWMDKLWPALQKQLGINSLISNSHLDNCSNSDKNIDIFKNNTDISTMYQYLSDSNKNDSSICILSSVVKELDVGKCRIPKLPSPVLCMHYEKSLISDINVDFIPDKNILVSQSSPLVKVVLVNARKLTSGDDVKATLELTFKFKDELVEFQPGDSFGFICDNPINEVETLFDRLNLSHLANVNAKLNLHESCTNQKKIPSHIPPNLSLKQIFLKCVEIRSVPKKILLRILAEYTENEEERCCLLLLCSQEGSKFYADFVRKPSLSILDILMNFKSCNPPVEKLIEYLPPLKPRFYSVSSSYLEDRKCFKVVFNVIKVKKCDGRWKDRKGVCTGWLHDLSMELHSATNSSSSDITHKMSSLTVKDDKLEIYVYKRENLHFILPQNLRSPVIMVGPGTGVAPFIGFLQHREILMQNSGAEDVAETWLFYGCRYKERDFLYKNELQRLAACGVLTHLLVSFSREVLSEKDDMPRYVHENIKRHADGITATVNSGGKIFVCGDAKHMAHDVLKAFMEAFQACLDLKEEEAKAFIEKLQKEHRYVNDVWA